MTNSKMVKFEGTLGEFLEKYAKGVKFYCKDAGHAYDVQLQNINDLVNFYDSGVWFDKEQTWEEYVQDGGKVLCFVHDDNSDEALVVIDDIYVDTYEPYQDVTGINWEKARPATQAELEEYVWKG